MLKTALLFLAMAVGLCACQATGVKQFETNLQKIDPAKVASDVCATINIAMPLILVAETDPKVAAAVVPLRPVYKAVCLATNLATIKDLRSLANTALPQFSAAVAASNLSDSEKSSITKYTILAQAALSVVANVHDALEPGESAPVATQSEAK